MPSYEDFDGGFDGFDLEGTQRRGARSFEDVLGQIERQEAAEVELEELDPESLQA
jgi:hypothetical protein